MESKQTHIIAIHISKKNDPEVMYWRRLMLDMGKSPGQIARLLALSAAIGKEIPRTIELPHNYKEQIESDKDKILLTFRLNEDSFKKLKDAADKAGVLSLLGEQKSISAFVKDAIKKMLIYDDNLMALEELLMGTTIHENNHNVIHTQIQDTKPKAEEYIQKENNSLSIKNEEVRLTDFKSEQITTKKENTVKKKKGLVSNNKAILNITK